LNYVAPMLVMITTVLTLGAIFRSFFTNRRLRENARAWAELQGRLIDKFGSAAEVVRYLESDAGQRMLADQSEGGATPHGRILDSIHLGLLVLAGGIALIFGYSGSDPRLQEGLRTFGIVGTMLGIGFLASAGVSWALLRGWGKLEFRSEIRDANDSV